MEKGWLPTALGGFRSSLAPADLSRRASRPYPPPWAESPRGPGPGVAWRETGRGAEPGTGMQRESTGTGAAERHRAERGTVSSNPV